MSADDFQYDVFLSHSAKDKAVVRPLAERLRADGLKVRACPAKPPGEGGGDEWELPSPPGAGEGGRRPGEGRAAQADRIPAKIDPPPLPSDGGTRIGLEHSRVLSAAGRRMLIPGPSPKSYQPSTPNPQPTKRLDDAPVKGSLAQFLYIN